MDWVEEIRKSTHRIKQSTNTLFRQLSSQDVYFTMTGNNWRNDLKNRDALVIFSRNENSAEGPLLVVIPRKVVDEHIFDPIFEGEPGAVIFKPTLAHFEYKPKAINLLFNKEDGTVALRPKSGSECESVKLFRLPRDLYWKSIDLGRSIDPVLDLENEIIETIKDISDGKGVEPINRLL